MRTSQALREIAEITSEQWGLITAAQAQSVGIGRMQLSRLADSGHLEHVIHGVYKDAGSPVDNFETIKANWLAANPGKFAYERLAAEVPDFIASGITATHLFGIGDFERSYVQFTTPKRKQTQRPGIVFKTQVLKPENITYEQGLPVTRIEQTVTDLIAEHQDFVHVAQILAEASKFRNINESLLKLNFQEQGSSFGKSLQQRLQMLERLKDYAGMSQRAIASVAISDGSMKKMLDQLAKVSNQISTSEVSSAQLKAIEQMAQTAKELADSMEKNGMLKSIQAVQRVLQNSAS